MRISRAVIAHLEGGPFSPPDLMPWSPVKDFDTQIASEQTTVAEVLAFVNGSPNRANQV
ncbi:MAG TPA: hypothetical protein VIF02_01195 [Methylocella sp.]